MLSAGLPNITGANIGCNPNDSGTGAFYSIGDYSNFVGAGTSAWKQIGFSAQRSNSLYGSSSTVQPPALALIPQLKF